MKPSVALIGPGKVGCAISQRLQMAGYPITAVIGRNLERATDACRFIGCSMEAASTDLHNAHAATIILLAVPDDQIAALANSLTHQSQSLSGKTLIHFSGLHPAGIMRSGDTAAATLSLHPLLPFAQRELASKLLTNCPCALEGDEISIPLGIELVDAFAGQAFRIASEQKALYHASACIASNFLVTLLASAAELMTDCGVDKDQALPLLLPLVQATVDNVANLGPEQGLTGPIVRGDTGTVASHLAALKSAPESTLNSYKLLGKQTVSLAQKSNRLAANNADLILALISPGLVKASK